MAGKLTVLGVHGLGDHRTSPWKEEWEQTVRDVFPMQDEVALDFEFLSYDDIFEETNLSVWQTAAAVGKLVGSGLGSLFGARRRGFFDTINHHLRWYAGYVVAWVENEEFQRETRRRVLDAIQKHKPDVLLAHSLGSLITYNAITSPDASRRRSVQSALRKMNYVTLGSQIGNPFVVKNLTPGRIEPLDVGFWYHLYNEEDDVFTAPIRLFDADNFLQVSTFFDIEGLADHSAVEYLKHPATFAQVWQPLALQASRQDQPAPARRAVRELTRAKPTERPARTRALLIGINEYPDPGARLEGCVNDVFLMSSVLQECGFDSESIRVCLNDRATAKGIHQRIAWLLDDPRPDDMLVFYYSGHGARLPTYGEGDTVDRMDETLVPHDFDWSPETCVTDDQIFAYYSQLPYDTRLVMIFDCCHSGGIHRSGSLKARGIDPPDDIRHRGLRWNADLEMWEERGLEEINKQFTSDKDDMRKFCGRKRNTYRLGRAMFLRPLSDAQFTKRFGKRRGPAGPYLPVIIEACQEDEYSYEYRHGVTSYGAFTYTLAKTLRQRKRISFEQLVGETGNRLTDLRYDQEPQILGPKKVVRTQVPWRRGK